MSRIVVVTGATGFLGRHACAALLSAGFAVRALVRRRGSVPGAAEHPYRGLDDRRAIGAALEGAEAVVHLAARVHLMNDRAADPLAEYRAVNTEGTRVVAEMAAGAGVRSLVFASSVKVLGQANTAPWTAESPAAPVDPYGVSKLEAERAVADVAAEAGMRVMVLRLPVVYGAGMGANMLRLFQLADRGWILPLGDIPNRRSLVYVENAAAAIAGLLERPGTSGTFLVSDGEDVSTSDLVRRISGALGRPARLLPAPIGLLRLAERLGIPHVGLAAHRLVSSLTVDPGPLLERLGGPLPYGLDEGLARTAAWYRSDVSRH